MQQLDVLRQIDPTGDEAQQWYHEFIYRAATHSVAEELVLYPWLESHNALESGQEHQSLKHSLHELEHKEFGTQDFWTLYGTTSQSLKDHIHHEEKNELLMYIANSTPEERERMAKKFKMMKAIVPTRPHPNVPNSSVLLESFLDILVAPLDRLRDLGRSFPSET
jgi:hypothetical protein